MALLSAETCPMDRAGDALLALRHRQVLVTWLNHAPNYEEVTKWYLGWKQLIPEKLVGHAVVRGQLHAVVRKAETFYSSSPHRKPWYPFENVNGWSILLVFAMAASALLLVQHGYTVHTISRRIYSPSIVSLTSQADRSSRCSVFRAPEHRSAADEPRRQ